MGKKVAFFSDLTGADIANDREAVEITLRFQDARRGIYKLDAHMDDAEVKTMIEKGTQQARRGRKPKNAE